MVRLKKVLCLKVVIAILFSFIIFLWMIGQNYELCSQNITILALCGYLFCLILLLNSIKLLLLHKKKESVSTIVALFLLIGAALLVHKDLHNTKASYDVFSANDYTVVFRIKESTLYCSGSVYRKRNRLFMKKIGGNMGMPNNYDPIETGNYEIIENGSSVILKIKCDPKNDYYEEIQISAS